MPAPLTNKQYVLAGGGTCPSCRGSDISGDSIEVDGTICWQPVSCGDCGANWTDVYKLTGYDNLETNTETEKDEPGQ